MDCDLNKHTDDFSSKSHTSVNYAFKDIVTGEGINN